MADVVFSIIVLYVGQIPISDLESFLVILIFLILFSAPLGVFLLYRGRQYAALALVADLSDDLRPPVVYLRAFDTDTPALRLLARGFVTAELFSGYSTEEEQLAESVRPIGPMIAIGQPGERMPKPGAVRLYTSEGEWQKKVNEFLVRACLVIVRTGTTQGVRWELARAVEILTPRRLLILVLEASVADYERFTVSVMDELKISLPLVEGHRSGRISGFIGFRDNWSSYFLNLQQQPSLIRASRFKALKQKFTYTLQPVFGMLGVEWKPPPISIQMIAFYLVIGILSLFLLAIVVDNALR